MSTGDDLGSPLQLTPCSPLHCGGGPVFMFSTRTPDLGTSPHGQPAQELPRRNSTTATEEAASSHGDALTRQPFREGETLTVFFPLPDYFVCPEDGCTQAFRSATWTSQRQSLTRHLEQGHNYRIRKYLYLCLICNEPLGNRPKNHKCSLTPSQPAQPSSRTSFRHVCSICHDSFPSKKGLYNHTVWHRREEARAAGVDRNRAMQPLEHHGPAATPEDDPELNDRNSTTAHPSTTASQLTPEDDTCGPPADSSVTTPNRSIECYPTELPSGIITEPSALPAPIQVEEAIDILIEGNDAPPPSGVAPQLGPEVDSRGSQADSLATASDGSEACISAEPLCSDTIESSALTTTDQVEEAGGIPAEEDDAQHPAQSHDEARETFVLSSFVPELNAILDATVSDASWARFEGILEEATKAASSAVRLPPPRNEGSRIRQLNPEDPRQIQKLYKRNRRQAVRLICDGPSTRCQIPCEQVENHFSALWQPEDCDTSFLQHRPCATTEMDLSYFTPQEVRRKAAKTENTAPGDDRLTYRHWLDVDPDGIFMAVTFNICLKYKRVPASWRTSKTVLIFKKGNPDEISNWRPISIARTLNKLYAGCLASRLQSWIAQNDVLSHTQKGFMPYDGVYEHNFILQRRINDARANNRELCAAFLDFSNAFGSIPHSAIIRAVEVAGAGPDFTAIISDLYSGNTSRVLTSGDSTAPIPMERGIRQGCPLSGLLFNLAIDPILRDIQGPNRDHAILAYADDLTPLAEDPQLLQHRIDRIVTLASSLRLSLNPSKCRTLHISGHQPVGLRDTVFHINGRPISTMAEFESFNYLGRPVGFNVLKDVSTIDTAINTGKRILTSMLAPWQRLDALKTFVYPSLNFAMRCGRLGKTDWTKLDQELRPLIKRTLYIPNNATNDYIYGKSGLGCCGIPLAAETSDIARIDGAFKLLTSRDPAVARIAKEDLFDTVGKRLRTTCSPSDVEGFLSGDTEGSYRASTNELCNVWTEARKASRRLCVTWTIEEGGATITRKGQAMTKRWRARIMRTIRDQLDRERTDALHNLANQGKVMDCAGLDPSSTHFFRTGLFTRFADWRFVHRARLNLLPLNGARTWANGDKRCRRCGYQNETLPHVVCHCMRQSQAMTRRHNDIVDRVRKASTAKFTIISENRPVGDTQLRPDIILARGEEAIIVDITCPFENRQSAFEEARTAKVTKYQPVKEYLQRRFQRVTIEPVVVGALGCWDPKNDHFLRRLCSRRYLKKMKKLCVSAVISATRDIYAAHIASS
ncbi:uncharacterized protein LOC135376255 [Ornithodoros turicata]|uniref:uncharacterized protein LOC135376255 n=1 Tax=Ornithodoros turicata TaxID=34597 RepID=UPI0031389F9A